MRSSLIQHADWAAILDALDVRVPVRALPAEVRCPLCRGRRLRVYEDTISLGTWHYCFGCGHSGDMVALAASHWGVGPEAAVAKLDAAGVPVPRDSVADYVAVVERARRVDDVWAAARKNLCGPYSSLNPIRHRLGLGCSVSVARWKAGPGSMLGGASVAQISEAGIPCRRLPGKRWGDLLLTPYYSHPGKICGFAMAGRMGEPAHRSSYHLYSREGGLAGMPSVEASKGMLGEFVVAVEDPWMMLKLQVKHSIQCTVPLPLVSWFDAKRHATASAWKSLVGRVPVFCVYSEVIDAGLLHQAIISDGRIALGRLRSYDKKATDHYIRDHEPRVIVQRMIKRSKPWREAVVEWAEKVGDGVIEDALYGLRSYGHDIGVVASLSERLRLLARIPEPEAGVRIAMGAAAIEKGGKLWAKTKEGTTLMMDAVLRFDGTVFRKPDSQNHTRSCVHYKGRLIFEGTEIPFEVPWTTIHDRTAEKLKDVSARAVGKAVYVAPSFARKILQAAEGFSGPQNVAKTAS